VLESFAFDLAWDRRDETFRRELLARHAALIEAIDRGDEEASILRELALHTLVFETAGHKLLLSSWNSLRGRLQLYWAAHHRAHSRRGPKRESHDIYVELALGEDLGAMKEEIRAHMQRGAEVTEAFLESRANEDRHPQDTSRARR
jgi:DNA-binding GntR family transcriptional regulator